MVYDEKKVEMLRQRYPKGTRICLDSMENDPFPIPSGSKGTVECVDDAGNIIMKWDSGHSLSLIPGEDRFGSQPHSMWADFPQIDMASRRLQKVVVENRDFEKLIRQYDRSVSFFYCDSPYFATENYYKDVGFKTSDHIRLRDSLLDIKGKFLVSYNDCPEIREIWDKPNIHIEEISRLNNLAQRYEGGCMYEELFISNYDTSERRNMIKQFSLFDDENGGFNV